jgi:DNA-binding transcriptional LysR family regulator
VDLSLLRTCLAVYRAGSLTKAARALGISQPAVTGQLRALEEKLEQPLFLRMPDGTVPTDAAHELVRDTAEALDRLEGALWRRLKPEQLSDRTIRLAGPVEIISTRVLPAVADLINEGLRLQVALGLTEDLLPALADGTHDMVISTRRPRHRALVSTPLMDEEFVLVGAGAWAEGVSVADIRRYGPKVLENVPMISYADGLPIVRRYWTTVFEQPPTCPARVVVPDLRAVLAAVKSGAGISVLPGYLCTDEIARGEISVLYEPEIPPLNTLFLATRAGGAASFGLTALRSHLLMKAQLWR